MISAAAVTARLDHLINGYSYTFSVIVDLMKDIVNKVFTAGDHTQNGTSEELTNKQDLDTIDQLSSQIKIFVNMIAGLIVSLILSISNLGL